MAYQAAQWSLPAMRMTNADVVVAQMNAEVREGDLILIAPWSYGVAFAPRYTGPAEWTTIPPIDDHRFHRYDLVKQRMIGPDGVDEAIERMKATLRAGGTIWYVGDLTAPPKGTPPLRMPPPNPEESWTWNEGQHNTAWAQQVGDALRTHAAEVRDVTPATSREQWCFERIRLCKATGWRE